MTYVRRVPGFVMSNACKTQAVRLQRAARKLAEDSGAIHVPNRRVKLIGRPRAGVQAHPDVAPMEYFLIAVVDARGWTGNRGLSPIDLVKEWLWRRQ